MNTKDKEILLEIRKEYEQSGLTQSKFAELKEMEYHKMNYILRKALKYQPKAAKPSFTRLKSTDIKTSRTEMIINTSYGAQIIIPI